MKIKHFRIGPPALLLLSGIIGGATVIGTPQSLAQLVDQEKPYGTVYHVGKDISAPIQTKYVPPEFPASAGEITAPFAETVEVGLIVDASGMPREVHVVSSFKPDFDAEAIKAVKQYRFRPGERSGKPVAVWLRIRVVFRKN